MPRHDPANDDSFGHNHALRGWGAHGPVCRDPRPLGAGFEARDLLGYIDHQLLADILEAQMG
jgi:hypothetical protein